MKVRRSILAGYVALALVYGWSSLAPAPSSDLIGTITDWIRCVVKPQTCEGD